MSSKWFRDASDSDESEDSNEESEQATSEEEQSSDDAQARRRNWLRGGGDGDDSDDSQRAGKVLSKRQKANAQVEKAIQEARHAMNINDHNALETAVSSLAGHTRKMSAGGFANLPSVVLKCAAVAEQFMVGIDKDKERKRGFDAVRNKQFVALKKTIKSFCTSIDTELKVFKETWDPEDVSLDEHIEDDDDDEGFTDEEEEEFGKKKELAEDDDEKDWTPEVVRRKLNEVLGNRGKKGTDRVKQIEGLQRVLKHATEPATKVEIQCHLIAACFEASPTLATHLPANLWKSAYEYATKLLNQTDLHPEFVLVEAEDDLQETPSAAPPSKPVKIPLVTNFTALLDRLDAEYVKSLQFTDCHTLEYVQRFQDEGLLLDFAERVYHYYVTRGLPKHAARVALTLMEHLYYRRTEEHVAMLAKQRNMTDVHKAAKKNAERVAQQEAEAAAAALRAEADGEEDSGDDAPTATPVASEDPKTPLTGAFVQPKKEGPKVEVEADEELFANLSQAEQRRRKARTITNDLADTLQRYLNHVLKHGEDKAKVRALLLQTYHIALHGNFYEARDLMLMSHINEVVLGATSASNFHILYNRVLAQLGLAAFRLGAFKDVNVCLNELCANQRMRELLAQGMPMTRGQERRPEQEKQDKLKLTPFHMHVNLDALEAAHLVASMLLEVPGMVANPFDTKRRVHSKAFVKILNHYNNQVFVGPPENVRDHVFAASSALRVGDWRKCRDLIIKLKVWDLLPDSENLRNMLEDRIKEEALRSYLFQSAQYYDSISLKVVAEQFELPHRKVHSIIAKAIVDGEFAASFDQPADCIRIRHTQPTKLQHFALRAADRAEELVKNNERTLSPPEALRQQGFGQREQTGAPRPPNQLWGGNNNNNNTNTNNYNNNYNRGGGGGGFGQRSYGNRGGYGGGGGFQGSSWNQNRGGGGGNAFNSYNRNNQQGRTGGNWGSQQRTYGGGGGFQRRY